VLTTAAVLTALPGLMLAALMLLTGLSLSALLLLARLVLAALLGITLLLLPARILLLIRHWDVLHKVLKSPPCAGR
jgi:4-hydroxybenzoate polyprenyltransferase